MTAQPPPALPGFEPVATVTELPQRPARKPAAKPAELPQDDVTSSLVEAVGKVYRVVTAQIAYHEAEVRRLREALKPFAGIPAAAEPAIGPDDALAELLAIAKRLPTSPSD